MDYQDLKPKELVYDSGINQSTISRHLNGDTICRNKKTLVALCCGLKLEPSLSKIMFKKCGLSLDDSNEDSVLKYILTNMLDSTPMERTNL